MRWRCVPQPVRAVLPGPGPAGANRWMRRLRGGPEPCRVRPGACYPFPPARALQEGRACLTLSYTRHGEPPTRSGP